MDTTLIYALVSTRDLLDIRYIGKTDGTLNNRLYNHVRGSKNKNTYKDNWIRKETREGYKIRIILLDVVPTDGWQFWEMYWISEGYRLGYKLTNTDPGGDSRNNMLSIMAFTYNGEYVNTYSSIAKAARDLNLLERNISEVVQNKSGHKKSHKGYTFIKESEYDPNKDYTVNIKVKATPVYQYDLEGNFIKKWDRMKEATDYYNMSKSNISNACKGIQKSTGGYQWRYTKEKQLESL